MCQAPRWCFLAWQDIGAVQEEGHNCRGCSSSQRAVGTGWKVISVQCFSLGCVHRDTRSRALTGTGLHRKPECGVQEGPQRSQGRAGRRAEDGKGAHTCGYARLGLVATELPSGSWLRHTGCIRVVCAPAHPHTGWGRSDSLPWVDKKLANPLCRGWQEQGVRVAGLLRHRSRCPAGSPAPGTGADVRPLAGGWESSDLHPAGSSGLTAGAGTDPPRSPRPGCTAQCHTDTQLSPLHPRSAVPSPAPAAAPPLPAFGMQMAGDCRE